MVGRTQPSGPLCLLQCLVLRDGSQRGETLICKISKIIDDDADDDDDGDDDDDDDDDDDVGEEPTGHIPYVHYSQVGPIPLRPFSFFQILIIQVVIVFESVFFPEYVAIRKS